MVGTAGLVLYGLRRGAALAAALAITAIALPAAASAHDRLREFQTGLDAMREGAPPPPAVTAASPLLAVVDSPADLEHSDLAHGNVVAPVPAGTTDEHGTAVISIAAAAADGEGIEGMWPGMRVLALPTDFSCADASARVRQAVRSGARVILMSYEGPACHTHLAATQFATAHDVALVAAAGNDGDPETATPGADPHVITVGALDGDRAAPFSDRVPGLDVMAPGTAVPAAVPFGASTGGLLPGWGYVDGTSFAAPFVAAAAAWIRAARPDLDAGQVGELLRATARDLAPRRYDAATGYGRMSLAAALAAPAPPRDAAEPDDDVEWVDHGSPTGPPAPLWTNRRRAGAVRGAVRLDEDGADVHRLKLCPRDRVRVAVRALDRAPVRLVLLDRRARHVGDARATLARRLARPGRPATVRLEWAGYRMQTTYAAVEPVALPGSRAGRYRLTVRRIDKGASCGR